MAPALMLVLVAAIAGGLGGGVAAGWPGLGVRPALAQAPQATGDTYAARAVPIAATAESPAIARERAIAAGQVDALRVVLERIADPAQAGRLPQVSRDQVLPMVDTYSLSDERITDTSYSARLTVRFNGPAVRRLLEGHGIGHAVEASQPVLVVPVYQADPGRAPVLWEDTNPWLAAWRRQRSGSVLMPVEVPTGDLADVTTLSPDQALTPDGTALAALLDRYDRDTVLVAHGARSGPDTLEVALHYGSPRAMARTGSQTLRRQAGEDDAAFLARAAADVARRLEADWRDANLVRAGAEQTVTALVTLGGFSDWMAIRRGLERAPLVRHLTLQAMTRDMAQLTLSVQGDAARVGEALATQGLSLTVQGGYWLIGRAGAAGTTPGGSVYRAPNAPSGSAGAAGGPVGGYNVRAPAPAPAASGTTGGPAWSSSGAEAWPPVRP